MISQGLHQRIRVLVVEDMAVSRLLLCQLLQRSGFFCTGAANGGQALEMVHSFRPQAILMDLRMPGIDGFETTRRLKSYESTASIPVLALTGSSEQEDRDSALSAGVDEFLTKPINLDQLLLALRRHHVDFASPNDEHPLEESEHESHATLALMGS